MGKFVKPKPRNISIKRRKYLLPTKSLYQYQKWHKTKKTFQSVESKVTIEQKYKEKSDTNMDISPIFIFYLGTTKSQLPLVK